MSKLAIDRNAKGIQVLRPASTDTVSVSNTAASSSAISAEVRVARLMCTVDCHYTLDGTATTSECPLPAGAVEFIHVYEGDTISFISSDTSTGTAYVTEMV